MSWFYPAIAAFLLLNVVIGMARIVAGPTRADRMLAAQLLGTTSVAMLLLLAEATGRAALRDVALVFAILAAVATVAFVRRAGTREPMEAGGQPGGAKPPGRAAGKGGGGGAE